MNKLNLITALLIHLSVNIFSQAGDQRYNQALDAENNCQYTAAINLYTQARELYQEENNLIKANQCRYNIFHINRLTVEFPYSEDQMLTMLRQEFPQASDYQLHDWMEMNNVERIYFDNQWHYYEDFIKNIYYRNLDLIQAKKVDDPFFDILEDIIFKPLTSGYPAQSWKPYVNPVSFLVEGKLNIARAELPDSGLLKLWIPLPVQTGSQFNVRIIEISPSKYVNLPVRTDGDMGLAYVEIPLEELTDDLLVTVKFSFSSYQQQFIINADRVGNYDQQDWLYRKYTQTGDNIVVSQNIRTTAEQITAGENNPYYQAKKIYQYIIDNIYYSHVPHLRLAALGFPEAEYVHQNHFGDCGAQSIYFCSLCRSIGIPARTTGGYQLVPGVEGCHFWAEFYLPNYGWIPVDVTVAESSDWTDKISESQRDIFQQYFFGNLDPYRMVIQKDVDVVLNPLPDEEVIFTMAIQYPAAVCSTCDQDIGFKVVENWNFSFYPLYH
ncbi:MAG: transglutaminase-like domain-containing protein [bacterium]